MQTRSSLIALFAILALAALSSASTAEDEMDYLPEEEMNEDEMTDVQEDNEDEDNDDDEEDEEDEEDELELMRHPGAVELLELTESCISNGKGNAEACALLKKTKANCNLPPYRRVTCRKGNCNPCKALAFVRRMIAARGVYKVFRMRQRVSYLAKKFNTLRDAYKLAVSGRRVVPRNIKNVILKTFHHVKVLKNTKFQRTGLRPNGWKKVWKKWGWAKDNIKGKAKTTKRK